MDPKPGSPQVSSREMDSNADSNGIQLCLFAGIRRCTQTAVELLRQDVREHPRKPNMTLGVKWSQVQTCQPDPVVSQDIGIAVKLLRFGVFSVGVLWGRRWVGSPWWGRG